MQTSVHATSGLTTNRYQELSQDRARIEQEKQQLTEGIARVYSAMNDTKNSQEEEDKAMRSIERAKRLIVTLDGDVTFIDNQLNS